MADNRFRLCPSPLRGKREWAWGPNYIPPKLTEARAIWSSDGVAYVQKALRLIPGANKNSKSVRERRIDPNARRRNPGF